MNRLSIGVALLIILAAGSASATPVYNDLWDISNGASFAGSTGVIGGAFNQMGMFGQTLTQYESGTTFFADSLPANTVHSISWTTPVIATGIGSFNLTGGGDNGDQRAINRFVLWAGTSASTLQVIFDSGAVNFTVPGTEYSHAVTTVVSNATTFKADFYQAGSTPYSGPRIIELDGFAPSLVTPEPATFALGASGISILILALRLRRRAN